MAQIPSFKDIQRVNREKQNSVIETAINLWTDVFVDAIDKWIAATVTNRDRMKIVIPAVQLSGFHQFTQDQRARILDTIRTKFVDAGWLHIEIVEDEYDEYNHNYPVIIEHDMTI